MGYTTAELITAVRDEFGEDTAATSAVSDTQILQFLNQAQREMCWGGNILLTCAATASTAGQEQYPLPSDYLKICAVFMYRTDGLKRKLHPVMMQQRNAQKRQSLDQRAFYVWGINVAAAHKYYIGLQDIPSATSLTNDIEIYYRQLPLTMTIGGGTVPPEVPDQWQDGLIQGALMRIYSRMCTQDSKWLPMFDRKSRVWANWIVESKKYVNPLMLDHPIQIADTMGYTRERENILY